MAERETFSIGMPCGVDFKTLRREFVKEFCAADKDQSSKLGRKEFMTCLEKWDMGDCEFLFDLADTDRSGEIDIKEFLAFCEAMLKLSSDEDMSGFIKLAFKSADVNGAGELNMDQFKNFIRYIGVNLKPGDIDRIYRTVDTDGNGKISLPELLEKYNFILAADQ